jgi:hypothetical protein
MREPLDRILRDVTLVTLALALGWTLVLAAQGVADTVSTLLTHYQHSDLLDIQGSRPLTWVIGGRILTFNSLVTGLVAFAVVLAVALLIRKRTPPEAGVSPEVRRVVEPS